VLNRRRRDIGRPGISLPSTGPPRNHASTAAIRTSCRPSGCLRLTFTADINRHGRP
jgi:hypothetical protein